MAVTFSIESTDRLAYLKRDSLRIEKQDHVETCRFTTFARDLTSSAYRPALGDDVLIQQVRLPHQLH